MKFVEQTKFVTNGELEKHNTLRGLTTIFKSAVHMVLYMTPVE